MALLAAWTAPAQADVGLRDQPFTADTVVKPSGQKPQSKLWYHDGFWWGDLFDQASQEYHVFRLDHPEQASGWTDTGTVIDPRNSSEADVLSAGSKLYVASATDEPSSPTSGELRFYRYTYVPATRTYVPDAGNPVTISSTAGPVEAVVMDRDSQGRFWVTYTAPLSSTRTVYVSHTDVTGNNWVTPYALPFSDATTLTSDDIAAIVSFSGKIGVMWSNQTDEKMHFAEHLDGAGDQPADWSESVAFDQPKGADDHINLKSLEADPAGRVFAAVKTSKGDGPAPTQTDPLVQLLIRRADNSWDARTFGTVADDHTRPIVLTDRVARKVYVLATHHDDPNEGVQEIYYKEASLDDPIFAPGVGLPLMSSDSGLDINDVTSTKQDLGAIPSLAALASDPTNYWHNSLTLSHPAPPPPAGGGSPSTPSSPPAVDATGPELTALSLRPALFRPAKRRASTGGSRGTRVRFRMSEPAGVVFRVLHRGVGRSVGGRCVRTTRGNRSRPPCILYAARRGSFGLNAKAGANSVVFTGRLRGRALTPGRYRLLVGATDAAGNRSATRRMRFDIAP